MKIYNAYLKRITMSPLLYVSILGVFAICCFGMSSQSGHPGGVIFMYDVMLDISSYRKLIMLFATLPFGTVYCREWNEKKCELYYLSFVRCKAFISVYSVSVYYCFSGCIYGNNIKRCCILHQWKIIYQQSKSLH